jgi:hypothetical protein
MTGGSVKSAYYEREALSDSRTRQLFDSISILTLRQDFHIQGSKELLTHNLKVQLQV